MRRKLKFLLTIFHNNIDNKTTGAIGHNNKRSEFSSPFEFYLIGSLRIWRDESKPPTKKQMLQEDARRIIPTTENNRMGLCMATCRRRTSGVLTVNRQSSQVIMVWPRLPPRFAFENHTLQRTRRITDDRYRWAQQLVGATAANPTTPERHGK